MSEVAAWVATRLGHVPADEDLFRRALTHPSFSPDNYERLEFMGDRVLGVAVARWLYLEHPGEPEGQLSRRYNVLVSRETCGAVARELGIPGQVRLGKQARDDGAADSDNVLGDVLEALLGALLLDGGLDAADRLVRSAWGGRVNDQGAAPRHPKSALQELAAARRLPAPTYETTGRRGPHHLPCFVVEARIRDYSAQAEGTSKQEAETAAAAALLEKLS